VISRYLVITLAFVAAGVRASQSAWIEACGLAGLGLGLTFLKLATRWPILRVAAYAGFTCTGLSMLLVLLRRA
jgi:hypothetical protein